VESVCESDDDENVDDDDDDNDEDDDENCIGDESTIKQNEFQWEINLRRDLTPHEPKKMNLWLIGEIYIDRLIRGMNVQRKFMRSFRQLRMSSPWLSLILIVAKEMGENVKFFIPNEFMNTLIEIKQSEAVSLIPEVMDQNGKVKKGFYIGTNESSTLTKLNELKKIHEAIQNVQYCALYEIEFKSFQARLQQQELNYCHVFFDGETG
jgi:hypothetical protein